VAVVDTGNYFPRTRDGPIAEIEAGLTESRWVAKQLGRPVVKAFNGIDYKHLLEMGRPAGTPGRIALPVAGDSPTAKAVVIRLIDPTRIRCGRCGWDRRFVASAWYTRLLDGPQRCGRPSRVGGSEQEASTGIPGARAEFRQVCEVRLSGRGYAVAARNCEPSPRTRPPPPE
jgi:hypothetical protein